LIKLQNHWRQCDLKFVFAAAANLCFKMSPAKSCFKTWGWNLTPSELGFAHCHIPPLKCHTQIVNTSQKTETWTEQQFQLS
jgi:hypothetical protein